MILTIIFFIGLVIALILICRHNCDSENVFIGGFMGCILLALMVCIALSSVSVHIENFNEKYCNYKLIDEQVAETVDADDYYLPVVNGGKAAIDNSVKYAKVTVDGKAMLVKVDDIMVSDAVEVPTVRTEAYSGFKDFWTYMWAIPYTEVTNTLYLPEGAE